MPNSIITPDDVFSFKDKRDVEELIMALFYTDDSLVRYRAAEALGNLEEKISVDFLIDTLDDDDGAVRKMAAYALGEIGDKKATNPLIKSIENENRDYMEICIFALGEIGGKKAIEYLIWVLEWDEEHEIRCMAADALAKVGSYRAVPALIAALKDENNIVRYSAADALGELGDERAVNPLINALNDESWQVRKCSLNALRKIRKLPFQTLISLLNEEDPHVKERAISIIERTGDAKFIPYLQAMINDEDPDVCECVGLALKTLKTKKNRKNNVNQLSKSKIKNNNKKQPINGLGNISSDEALDILIEALSENDPDIRNRAAKALGEINDPIAVPHLINALNDENASVQWRVLEALAKIKEPAVLPLIGALSDEDPDIRSGAACALGEIGDNRAIMPLVKNLKDENPKSRWKTVLSLIKFGEQSVNPLIEVLKEDNIMVKKKAIEALEEIASSDALEALLALSQDADYNVRHEAEEAVGRIKRKNLNFKP